MWYFFQIPSLYDSILNHPNTSDELRSEVESKQLRYKQRQLFAIPSSNDTLKRQVSTELNEIVEGIVLLRKPDDLGWKIFFEEKDDEEIGKLCSPLGRHVRVLTLRTS